MNGEDSRQSYLKWLQVPQLRDPYLVAGFQGWSNAGNISTDTLRYLKEAAEPIKFASLSDEGFLNYTLDRPMAHVEDGVILDMDPPETEIAYWRNPEEGQDVILLNGKEPHIHWMEYCAQMLEIATRLNVKRLYTVGGVQDTVSHLSPPVISVVGSSAEVVASVLQFDAVIRPADYHGPVSIHSFLMKCCSEAGMEAATLWGHVPAYLQKSPRVVYKLITILNKAIGTKCPVQILRQQSIEMDRKIGEALAKDPSLRQFVESIEEKQGQDEVSSSADKIIHMNDFIRRDSKKDPEP
jgi:proteasome assembly chaperone (PAC2) family protein